jgi:hypothetical protein
MDLRDYANSRTGMMQPPPSDLIFSDPSIRLLGLTCVWGDAVRGRYYDRALLFSFWDC